MRPIRWAQRRPRTEERLRRQDQGSEGLTDRRPESGQAKRSQFSPRGRQPAGALAARLPLSTDLNLILTGNSSFWYLSICTHTYYIVSANLIPIFYFSDNTTRRDDYCSGSEVPMLKKLGNGAWISGGSDGLHGSIRLQRIRQHRIWLQRQGPRVSLQQKR
jgi:hypothetical protein